MVGIGGRSKACGQCRRRRVKCDERRPHCLRCIKAKLECSGYPEMTIIQFDGQKRHKISPSPPQVSQVTVDAGVGESIELVPRSVSRGRMAEFTFSTDLLTTYQIPLDFNDVFIQYTRSKLFGGLNSDEVAAPEHNTRYEDRAQMNKAFLALSTTFFGIEHEENRLVSRGFHQYGQSLEYVHGALGDPTRYTSLDLLESIVTMALFEFLISDRQDGWLSHTIGIEKLYALRGPESFTSLSALKIFENSRPSIIFSSLLLRRNTVLCEPEWKVLPWVTYPERKTAMQRLVDHLADCPGLFVEKDRIVAESSTTIDQTSDLIKFFGKVTDLLDSLQQWNEQWELENPDYCYEIPAPTSTPLIPIMSDGSAQVQAWSTVLEYKTLYHANTIIMYHGTIILLLNLARGIMKLSSFSTLSTYPPLDFEKLHNSGISICRSVEYHLQSMRQGAGSFFLLYPLRMAYAALVCTEPSIGLWIQDVLQQIQDGKSGRWATAKYLLHLQPASRTSSARVFVT